MMWTISHKDSSIHQQKNNKREKINATSEIKNLNLIEFILLKILYLFFFFCLPVEVQPLNWSRRNLPKTSFTNVFRSFIFILVFYSAAFFLLSLTYSSMTSWMRWISNKIEDFPHCIVTRHETSDWFWSEELFSISLE